MFSQRQAACTLDSVEASAAAWCRWSAGPSTAPTALSSGALVAAMVQQYSGDALAALAGYPPVPLAQWLCATIPTLRRIVDAERRLETAASCMLSTRDIVTLWEFDDQMRRCVAAPRTTAAAMARPRNTPAAPPPPPFETLGLGPLLCQHIVRSAFGPTVAALEYQSQQQQQQQQQPAVVTPHQISTLDVVEALLRFSEERRGAIDSRSFVRWLAAERLAANANPALLGVRIVSLVAHQRTVGHFLANRRQMVRQLQTNLASSNWKRFCDLEKASKVELAKLERVLKQRVQDAARAKMGQLQGSGGDEEEEESDEDEESSEESDEEEDGGDDGGVPAAANAIVDDESRLRTSASTTVAASRRLAVHTIAPSTLRHFTAQCARARGGGGGALDCVEAETLLAHQFGVPLPALSAGNEPRFVTAAELKRCCDATTSSSSLTRSARSSATTERTNIAFLHALRCGFEEELHANALGNGAAAVDCALSSAIRCLRSAPPLAELTAWTQWDTVFAPHHGPLAAFLHVRRETLRLPGGGPFALALGPRTLLSLRRSSSTSASADESETASCSQRLGQMLRASDARQSAAAIVAAVVVAGSVASAPWALLRAEAGAAIAHRLSEEAEEETFAAFERCARLVLDCASHLPRELLRATAAARVLMPALAYAKCSVNLASVSGWESGAGADVSIMHEWLMVCAEKGGRDEDVTLLRHLGLKFGLSSWTHAFHHQTSESTSAEASDGKPAAEKLADLKTPAVASTDIDVFDAMTEEADVERISAPVADFSFATSLEENRIAVAAAAAPASSSPEEYTAAAARCRALIDTIRREEFGVGILRDEGSSSSSSGDALSEGDAVYNRLVYSQQNRLGRALQRLAQELYCEDSHFLFELLQNADDNRYDPDSIPTLAIELDRHAESDGKEVFELLVFNNELGFRVDDVRALCDVGASTKALPDDVAAAAAMTGEKGIGFKAVFRVTATPEIHSRSAINDTAFHFRFEAHDSANPLGMIVPHWCREHPRWQSGGTGTLIALPLNAARRSAGASPAHMQAHLEALQPHLLLFLRRIRCLTVKSGVAGEGTVEFRRYDSGDALSETGMVRTIEVTHMVEKKGGASKMPHIRRQRWLVVSSDLKCPSALEAQMRLPANGVAKLVVAFPLDNHESDVVVPTVPVFSFLPVRDYGLRFAVQAPWELPSSRETIDASSVRNQWLRSQLAPLVMRGWGALKLRLDEAKAAATPVPAWLIRSAARMWRLMPLPGSIHGFFRPFANELIATLAKSRIPTVPALVATASGRWQRTLVALPSTIRLPRWLQHQCRALCQRAFDPSLLNAIGAGVGVVGSKHALVAVSAAEAGAGAMPAFSNHPWDDERMLSPAIRSAVGMRSLCESDFVQLLQRWAERGADRSVHELDAVRWLSAACATLQYLYERRGGDRVETLDTIASLRAIPFLPLADGEWTSIDEGAVFLPTDSELGDGEEMLTLTSNSVSPPPGVRFVHSSLVAIRAGESEEDRSAVRRLLHRLGVGTLCPRDVVMGVIVPLYRDKEQWKACPDATLIWALHFLSLHFDGLLREQDAALTKALYSTCPIVLTTCGRMPCKQFVVGGYAGMKTLNETALSEWTAQLLRNLDASSPIPHSAASIELHMSSEEEGDFAAVMKSCKLDVGVAFLDARHGSEARLFGELQLGASPFLNVHRKVSGSISGGDAEKRNALVLDWISPEFALIAEAFASKLHHHDACIAQFAAGLIRRWESCYYQCAYVERTLLVTESSTAASDSTDRSPSTFAQDVRRLRWVPSASIKRQCARLLMPCEMVYVGPGSRELKALQTILGPLTKLVLPEASVLKELQRLDAASVDFIGFKRELDVTQALNLLESIIAIGAEGAVAACDLKGLFIFLQHHALSGTNAERSLINAEVARLRSGIIALSKASSSSTDGVVWSDDAQLCRLFEGRARCPVPPSLFEVYTEKLHPFFVDVMCIPEDPSFEQYSGALEMMLTAHRQPVGGKGRKRKSKVKGKGSWSVAQINDAITNVFRFWSSQIEKLESKDESAPLVKQIHEWLARLGSDNAVLPSTRLGHWVPLTDQTLAVAGPAEVAMAKKFGESEAALAVLLPSFCEATMPLLRQCGVRRLESAVEMNVEATGARMDVELAWIVQRLLRVAQRAIATKYAAEYAVLTADGGVGSRLVRCRAGPAADTSAALGGLLCYSAEQVRVTPLLRAPRNNNNGAQEEADLRGDTTVQEAVFYTHADEALGISRLVVHVHPVAAMAPSRPVETTTPWIRTRTQSVAPLWGRFDLNELCSALSTALCPLRADAAGVEMSASIAAVLRCASIEMMTGALAPTQSRVDVSTADPDAWIEHNLPSFAAKHSADSEPLCSDPLWSLYGLAEHRASLVARAAAIAASAAAIVAAGGDPLTAIFDDGSDNVAQMLIAPTTLQQPTTLEIADAAAGAAASGIKRSAPWESEGAAAPKRPNTAAEAAFAAEAELASEQPPQHLAFAGISRAQGWSARVPSTVGPSSSSSSSSSGSVAALAKRARTGREGEAVVHRYLRHKCAQMLTRDCHSGAHVVWLNEKVETGDAWDLILFEGGRKIHIEVKATIKRYAAGLDDAFDISPAEVQAASRLQDRYHIYRVHFGDGDARIECIPDPLALLRQSHLRLCIVLPPRERE